MIYDAINNSPILLDGGVGLFPIECVYGIIEVKSVLDKSAIENSAVSIGTIRGFAKEKRYIVMGRAKIKTATS